MHSPGINGEGELRGQPANPGSPGKMAVKTECVCVCFKSFPSNSSLYGEVISATQVQPVE